MAKRMILVGDRVVSKVTHQAGVVTADGVGVSGRRMLQVDLDGDASYCTSTLHAPADDFEPEAPIGKGRGPLERWLAS
jgi:hypothetical protein